MSDTPKPCVGTQPSGKVTIGFRCVVGILLLIAAFCVNVADAATSESDRCHTLAELYARVPGRLTPQGLAALQACLAVDPEPAAFPGAPAMHPQREWGEWPVPAPWTYTSEPWPQRPWHGKSEEH